MPLMATTAAGKLVERLEKVLRGPPPPRQLGDQNSVDPASLCELEDAVAREPVVPGSRCGFLEDAEHLEAAALGEGGELGNPSASRNASAAGQTAVMACSSTPASPRSASTRTALPDARITARALMPDPRSHGGACLSPGARSPRGISRGVATPRDPAGVCPAGVRPASLATHPHLPGPAPTCARAAQHPRHRPIEARTPRRRHPHTAPSGASEKRRQARVRSEAGKRPRRDACGGIRRPLAARRRARALARRRTDAPLPPAQHRGDVQA